MAIGSQFRTMGMSGNPVVQLSLQAGDLIGITDRGYGQTQVGTGTHTTRGVGPHFITEIGLMTQATDGAGPLAAYGALLGLPSGIPAAIAVGLHSHLDVVGEAGSD